MAGPQDGVAARLLDLAARVDDLDPAQVVGELEALKFSVWTSAVMPVATAPPTTPSRALDVGVVMERTGMSKDWLYREARAGRLPFARRHGRRVVFDEAGLTRWIDRRR